MKKYMEKAFTILLTALLFLSCGQGDEGDSQMDELYDPNEVRINTESNRIVIYQVMTRLFGNTETANIRYGTVEENGVGRFSDFTDTALSEIRNMGVTHIWYTGVIEHATMEDFTIYGIPLDDADVIKGRAGSPYAIKDYYDVNPILADNVENRTEEFEALVNRTHENGLAVIIDFVPNHVSREYSSDSRPEGIPDLGENDDQSRNFAPNNNFYYLEGAFRVPAGYDPLGSDRSFPTEDAFFDEDPAKATGNDRFTPAPNINDWFETVKLNYGVDIINGRENHFDPIPNTWQRMEEILSFWAEKGVDGFRCDMAEMVPPEFWSWVIPRIREINSDILFIAEIYNPSAYETYLESGFDMLYDKVGLYDSIRPLAGGVGRMGQLTNTWRESAEIVPNLLRFLENHDEQRIASPQFAGDMRGGIPAMTVTATLANSPVMLYFGQEVGEPGAGEEGYSGDDGRTSIFDYWGVPEHQKWMNNGAFDGAGLSTEQQELRAFYSQLFNLIQSEPALVSGDFYELHYANEGERSTGYGYRVYSYLRFVEDQQLIVIANFSPDQTAELVLKIPETAWERMDISPEGGFTAQDILMTNQSFTFQGESTIELSNPQSGIPITIGPRQAYILELEPSE